MSEPEYVTGETEKFTGNHTATPERETELIAHFHQCEVPFLTCPLCRELYDNIGYQAYKELVDLYPEDVESL